MSFEPGTYLLTNVKAVRHGKHVALDLSGGDQQTIMGFEKGGENGNINQHWEFEPAGNGLYHIKNAGFNKYLTFPDEANDGKQVIATDGPREWEVRVGYEGVNQKDDRPSIRIFVPGTEKNLDLKDHGDTTDGTIVQLWEQTPGQGQAWYFERV